jgi:hypothetical protein
MMDTERELIRRALNICHSRNEISLKDHNAAIRKLDSLDDHEKEFLDICFKGCAANIYVKRFPEKQDKIHIELLNRAIDVLKKRKI